jgi:hypothetical protein
MSEEKTYFQNNDVTVTSARFIVSSQTFAMRNITSVKAVEIEPDSTQYGWLIIVGIGLVLFGFAGSSIVAGLSGVALVVLGVYQIWQQSSTFAVVLATSAGEVSAYSSQDGKLIAAIVEALNRSIVERG